MFRIIFLFLLVGSSFGANILYLNDVACVSHHIFNYALAAGLANKGHNVTYFSADLDKNPPANLHNIHFDELYEANFGEGDESIDLMDMARETAYEGLISFHSFGAAMCRGVEENKIGIKTLLNYPDNFKFDLVIYDFTIGSCLLGIIKKFKYPPVVGVTPFNNPPFTVEMMGGYKLGLTASPFYTLHYGADMSIVERIHNGLFHFIDAYYRKYYAIPATDSTIKKVFGQDSPTAHELERLIQVALVNSHPSIDFAESLPPNVIEVGGLQIKEAKPVPDEMKEFIDKGKKGSVLMSLGTVVRSDMISSEMLTNIIQTFKQLPDYNFLWKFESDELPVQLPKNVMIRKWVPQNDVLAHPKIIAFISHVGLLSLHETLWWGKPIVAIPFIADQHRNAHKAMLSGFAIKLNFLQLNSNNFKNAIQEVIQNPKYTENIQLRSKRFRDQKETPLERAIWWCEYVLRNKKVDHLRTEGYTLGLIGSSLIDVQILILLGIFLALLVLYKLLQSLKNLFVTTNDEKKNN